MNSWAELIGLGSGLGVFSASKGILDTQVESTIEGTTTRMDLRRFDVNSSILGYIRVSEGDETPVFTHTFCPCSLSLSDRARMPQLHEKLVDRYAN